MLALSARRLGGKRAVAHPAPLDSRPVGAPPMNPALDHARAAATRVALWLAAGLGLAFLMLPILRFFRSL